MNYKKISLRSNNKNTVLIENPTDFPLIGAGSKSAVFKLSEEKCVKIYLDENQARAEEDALRRLTHLPFVPKFYEAGSNYVVMEYFNGPNLKKYLKNTTYVPDSITKKLLYILSEFKFAHFKKVDVSLKNIIVVGNEELKVVDFENCYVQYHPFPLNLLNDFHSILLKDSFLDQVQLFAPSTYNDWMQYVKQSTFDIKNIRVISSGAGQDVDTNSLTSAPLIGKGHQGAVYRISDDRCVKVYGNIKHALREQQVLLNNQHLPFIPKVYETGPNYVVMEYLAGPNLNAYLKKQAALSEEITRKLLDILISMKKAGFTKIDAPLRHIFITHDGFKFIDHVFSYTHEQSRPLELFKNLNERGFLDQFLSQVEKLDYETYKQWIQLPIPIDGKENGESFIIVKNEKSKSKTEKSESKANKTKDKTEKSYKSESNRKSKHDKRSKHKKK